MRETFNPIIVDAPQRSEEWYKARLGNVTGSGEIKTRAWAKKITAKQMAAADEYYANAKVQKSEQWIERMRTEYPHEYCLQAQVPLLELEERANYRKDIVGERLTGIRADEDQYVNKAMQWGVVNEWMARDAYKTITGNIVKDAPYMMHPTLLCGASPDGLVIDTTTGELGNVEIKCLIVRNHLYKVIKEEALPMEYFDQVQMQMWITGRAWCDFVAYDSRQIKDLQVFIKRIERDDFFIENVLVPSVTRFLIECDCDERQFYAIGAALREKMLAEYTDAGKFYRPSPLFDKPQFNHERSIA